MSTVSGTAFAVAGFAVLGFAGLDIAVLGLAAAARAAAALPAGFNGFDGNWCDAFAMAVPDRLLGVRAGFFTAVERFLAAGVLLDVAAAFPDDVFEDFLRVFLDIRLPFVAFGGSIIRQLQAVS
jgi:hypothetical protein